MRRPSFLHVDDLCDATARLVDRRRQLAPEPALLVGEPEALGYAEIQDIIREALHGEEWRTIRVPRPLAKAGAWLQSEVIGADTAIKPWMVEQASDYYVLDTAKARRLLEWEPRHTLRATLPKMVAALRQDPTAWYRTNKLNTALVAWYGQRKVSQAPAARSPADQARDGEHGHPADHSPGVTGEGMAHGPDGHMGMMDEDARRTRWAHYANIGLGLWLAASPLAFQAASTTVAPLVIAVTEERGLPPVEWRMQALAVSDVVGGLLVALFAALSLSRRTAWFAQWAVAFTGIWLLFAPLVFEPERRANPE